VKNEGARSRFILAQLYQQPGQDKEATAQLNNILKHNPPYELDFQAKLLLGQVSDLDQQSKQRLDKYFAALLKDPKNREYRDKIYYEMARLAYRQQKYADALGLLRTAAKVPTASKSQKGYTYLLAGRIYYENLHKYQLAAAYYDSTTQAMPKENPLYAATMERAGILKEFARQYTIIETQDSLQTLAKLPAAELDQRLSTYAAAELEAKRQAAAKALAAQKVLAQKQQADASRISSSPSALSGSQRDISNPNAFDATTAVASGAGWYFDNPTSLSTARAEFIRVWGDRRLQDNWRTTLTPSSSPNAPQNGGAPVSVTGNDQTRVNGGTSASGSVAPPLAADPLAEQNALAAKYRQDIPDTPAKLQASNQQVEAAMYELGGIYKEQLREKLRGYETYVGEVARYPRGEHAPDADYLLYLYYKDLPDPARAAQYAAALQREFPTSTYARLIADPLYREHERALHNAVAARLDSAFVLYKDQYFTKAKAAVARIERAYPKSDLTDRVAYLKLLLAIRTQPPVAVRASVAQFVKDYPDSKLVPQAQGLAGALQKAEAGQLAGALASTDKPVISRFRPGEIDNRLRILYEDNTPPPPAPAPTPPATAQPVPAAAATIKAATVAASVRKNAPAKASDLKAPASATPAPTGTGSAAPAGTAPAPAGAAPAGSPTAITPPATTSGQPAATSPTPAAPATPPAAPAMAYATQLSAAHAVVLVYPKGTAPTADFAAQLTTYNGKFFRASNLTVQPAQALGADQEMVVVRALQGSKVAQSYATKLRGPQSPLARLRGQGYQTLIISLANLALLQETGGDLAGYQQFYQKVYP